MTTDNNQVIFPRSSVVRSGWINAAASIGVSLLAFSFILFVWGAGTIESLITKSDHGFWHCIKIGTRYLQVGTLIGGLVALLLVCLFLFKDKTGRVPKAEHESFWEAFPFASLIFFVVAVFMVCDVGNTAIETSKTTAVELLVKLGLYLMAAIITAVVVLYGAHLIKFEGKITRLTDRVDDAATNAGEFTEKAKTLRASLVSLETTVGMTVLASEVSPLYHGIGATPPKSTERLDSYIRARSTHSIMANEAAFRSHNRHELKKEELPVARNVIASFLDETAWDLGQRCLVTNARNYTNFLVGAARGFEEECEKVPGLRVFYLTHTVATPAHLMNWPGRLLRKKFRACQPNQFMLEYMTYCRYFARRSSRFIHARLISASHEGFADLSDTAALRQSHITSEPFVFSLGAVKAPHDWNLPTYCNRWGIPHWSRISVGQPRESERFYSNELGYPMGIKPIPRFEDDLIPFLFAGTPTEIGGAKLTNHEPELYSLHWPIFHGRAENVDIPMAAGKRPNLDAALQALRDFVIEPETMNLLLKWCRDDKMRDIVHRGCIEFQKQVEVAANFTEDLAENAHKILEAFEFFQGFRWAFQSPDAVKRWNEVSTAVFILVNALLSGVENPSGSPEEPVEFREWFSRTFQTDKRLALCYARNAPGEADQGGRLCEQEFALIGLINYAASEPITKEMIADWLRNWKSSSAENPIRRIIGLRSSISDPWRHTEVSWFWGCEHGKPQLDLMVDAYCAALEKSCQIAD